MKLVFFDDFKLGIVKDDTVVDVSGAVSGIEHTSPQDPVSYTHLTLPTICSV